MMCLSLRQPYAELVVSGRKTVELRTWNTRFRGRFLVHASGSVESAACVKFGMDPGSVTKRAIIGSVELVDVVHYRNTEELMRDFQRHLASGKYVESLYGFVLRDPERLESPIGMPGRLGFFNVPV